MEEPPEAVCKISSEEFVSKVRERWEFDWGLAEEFYLCRCLS